LSRAFSPLGQKNSPERIDLLWAIGFLCSKSCFLRCGVRKGSSADFAYFLRDHKLRNSSITPTVSLYFLRIRMSHITAKISIPMIQAPATPTLIVVKGAINHMTITTGVPITKAV